MILSSARMLDRTLASSKKYSSSTRLLHDPFISSNVGPANNSGVRVSTLSRFITNAKKSRGVSISSLNDSRGSSIWAKELSQGDLPVVLEVFSFGALVDSGPFLALLLLDPQFSPAECQRFFCSSDLWIDLLLSILSMRIFFSSNSDRLAAIARDV
ncbi:hypothetical protein Tco_0705396 [Tanacetum coccineum]|uniref:Uncharacterized protein n=1 Tax=Tanacetum coccineum TaxID=301880 RepID=A0ABQ4Y4H0_9ASTR